MWLYYDSPVLAFDGKVITEVANLKEEGLVTPESGEGEKGISEIDLPLRGIELRSPSWKARVLTTTLIGPWY